MGNTSFDVVFLARVVGNVENTLFINTSHHGVFTYQVSYRKSVNTNSVPFFLWKGMLIGLGGLVSPLVQVFGVGIPNPYRLRPFIEIGRASWRERV